MDRWRLSPCEVLSFSKKVFPRGLKQCLIGQGWIMWPLFDQSLKKGKVVAVSDVDNFSSFLVVEVGA